MPETLSPAIVSSCDIFPSQSGSIVIRDLIGAKESPSLSVSQVEVNGINDLVRNQKSNAVYYVLKGAGNFVLEVDGLLQDFAVQEGDTVFIPPMIWYQDRGNMLLLAVYSPAFDASQVEKK